MFDVLARLHAKVNGKLEFHYVGATDPARYPEFAKAASFTICHGPQSSDGVRAIMARCHAGILTSYFEGLPCYLLEMLASGRPVGAIELPQYAPLILPGISGVLLARRVRIAPRHSPTRSSRYGATSTAATSIPCACMD
jgi:glycosyltransferase involved in cell wall biosynthesis